MVLTKSAKYWRYRFRYTHSRQHYNNCKFMFKQGPHGSPTWIVLFLKPIRRLEHSSIFHPKNKLTVTTSRTLSLCAIMFQFPLCKSSITTHNIHISTRKIICKTNRYSWTLIKLPHYISNNWILVLMHIMPLQKSYITLVSQLLPTGIDTGEIIFKNYWAS